MCTATAFNPVLNLKKSLRSHGQLLKGDIKGSVRSSLQHHGDVFAGRESMKVNEKAAENNKTLQESYQKNAQIANENQRRRVQSSMLTSGRSGGDVLLGG